ncbi:hypothetical protein GJ496_000067 [Pomphorhynchus laevis]|nr:hypothetical protein GJ496_000067 [Pomphorhynchus laevis]
MLVEVKRDLVNVFGYEIRTSNHLAVLTDYTYCHAVSNAVVVEYITNDEIRPKPQEIHNFNGHIRKIVACCGSTDGDGSGKPIIMVHTIENTSENSLLYRHTTDATPSNQYMTEDDNIHHVFALQWQSGDKLKFDLKSYELPVVDIDITKDGKTGVILSQHTITIWKLGDNDQLSPLVQKASVDIKPTINGDQRLSGISMYCKSSAIAYGTKGYIYMALLSASSSASENQQWKLVDISITKAVTITAMTWCDENTFVFGTDDGLLMYSQPIAFKSKIIDRQHSRSVTHIVRYRFGFIVLYNNRIVSLFYLFKTINEVKFRHSKDFQDDRLWKCKIDAMQVSESGQNLLLAFTNGKLIRFNISNKEVLFTCALTINVRHSHPKMFDVAGGKDLMIFLSKKTLKCTLHDLAKREALQQITLTTVNYCTFNPNYNMIAISTYDRVIYLYLVLADKTNYEYGRFNFSRELMVKCTEPMNFCKSGHLLAVWIGSDVLVVDVIRLNVIYCIEQTVKVTEIVHLEWSWCSTAIYSLHKHNIIACWLVLDRSMTSIVVSTADGVITSNICATVMPENLVFGTSGKQLFRTTLHHSVLQYSLVNRTSGIITCLLYYCEFNSLIMGFSDGRIRMLRYDEYSQKPVNWFELDLAIGSIERLCCGKNNCLLLATCADGPLIVYKINKSMAQLNASTIGDQEFCPPIMLHQKSYVGKFHELEATEIHDAMIKAEDNLKSLQASIDSFVNNSLTDHAFHLLEAVKFACENTRDEKCALIVDDSTLNKLHKATKRINKCLEEPIRNLAYKKADAHKDHTLRKYASALANNKAARLQALSDQQRLQNQQELSNKYNRTADQIEGLLLETSAQCVTMLSECIREESDIMARCETEFLESLKLEDVYGTDIRMLNERIMALKPEMDHYEEITDDVKAHLANVPNHVLLSAPEMVNSTFMQMIEKIVNDTRNDQIHSTVINKRKSYLRFAYHLQEAMLGFSLNDLEVLFRKYIATETETVMIDKEVRAKSRYTSLNKAKMDALGHRIGCLEGQLKQHSEALKSEYIYREATQNDLLEFLRGRSSAFDIMVLYNRRIEQLNPKFIDRSRCKAAKAIYYHYHVLLKRRKQTIQEVTRNHAILRHNGRYAHNIVNKHFKREIQSYQALDKTRYFLPKINKLKLTTGRSITVGDGGDPSQRDLIKDIYNLEGGVRRKRRNLVQLRRKLARTIYYYNNMKLLENELSLRRDSLRNDNLRTTNERNQHLDQMGDSADKRTNVIYSRTKAGTGSNSSKSDEASTIATNTYQSNRKEIESKRKTTCTDMAEDDAQTNNILEIMFDLNDDDNDNQDVGEEEKDTMKISLSEKTYGEDIKKKHQCIHFDESIEDVSAGSVSPLKIKNHGLKSRKDRKLFKRVGEQFQKDLQTLIKRRTISVRKGLKDLENAYLLGMSHDYPNMYGSGSLTDTESMKLYDILHKTSDDENDSCDTEYDVNVKDCRIINKYQPLKKENAQWINRRLKRYKRFTKDKVKVYWQIPYIRRRTYKEELLRKRLIRLKSIKMNRKRIVY